MSSSVIAEFTLTLTLGSNPTSLIWYVTDISTTQTIIQSNSSDFAKAGRYNTIQQNFSLPDNRTYLFSLSNPSGTGIDCRNSTSCYNLMLKNSNNTQPLFIGYGNFTCIEQYYIGTYVPSLQNPVLSGCPFLPLFPVLYVVNAKLYMIVGVLLSIFILVILTLRCRILRIDRIRAEEYERRRIQEGEIETEFQGKLNDARKESILSVLPRAILVDHLLLSEVGNNKDIPTQRITDLGKTLCPICLDAFKIEEEICSSPKQVCPHIYHTSCMMDWLLRDTRNDHQVCPMCRSDYF